MWKKYKNSIKYDKMQMQNVKNYNEMEWHETGRKWNIWHKEIHKIKWAWIKEENLLKKSHIVNIPLQVHEDCSLSESQAKLSLDRTKPNEKEFNLDLNYILDTTRAR